MTANCTPLPEPLYGERIIAPGETVESVGRTVAGIVLDPPASRHRWIVFAGCGGLLCVLAASLMPLGSGRGNASLVALLGPASRDAWIGIAHGSLLLSAILLLAGVEWRCAVSRIAETVAVLSAVAAAYCALVAFDPGELRYGAGGLYPHVGPPALWSAFGMACIIVASASLWFIGLLPDIATMRDHAREALRDRTVESGPGRQPSRTWARIYDLIGSGWRGSATQWRLWVEAYRAVALLGALLAIALQASGSVILAASGQSDRHDTLLPITLLVGAALGGVGVTAALVVTARMVDGLDGLITGRHLDILARLILSLGLASLYCHVAEIFSTLLLGDASARAIVERGVHGDLAWAFWTVFVCGLLPAQIFWLRRARQSALVIALVGTLTAIGAHADHVMALALTRPAGVLAAMADEAGIRGLAAFSGSIGLFLGLLLLVLRSLPMVSIAQTRQLVLAHNAVDVRKRPLPDRAAARGTVDVRWIEAEFGSEKEVAVAARALLGRDRSLRLEAFGPVPMEGAFEALRPTGRPLRRTALAGSFAGGLCFLLLGLTAHWLAAPDFEWPPHPVWLSLLLPSLSMALATGVGVILIAVLIRIRLPLRERSARPDRGLYCLAAAVGDGAGEADDIVRRLECLPIGDGRPMLIRWEPA